MRALHCSHRVAAGTQPPPEPSRAPAPATMHAPRIGTHPSTPEAAALTLFSCPTRRSKRREPSQCFKGLRSLVRPDPPSADCRRMPCTQRALLHPERRADPLNRSRCRRCRLGAFDSRTAAVRALLGVHACGCPNRCETRPRPHSCPCTLATAVPADSPHAPCPMPLPPSLQVRASRTSLRSTFDPFDVPRSRSDGRIGPVRAPHRFSSIPTMHATHPHPSGPVCAENRACHGSGPFLRLSAAETLLLPYFGNCRTVDVAMWLCAVPCV